MGSKGLDMSISLVVTILIAIAVVLILSSLLVSRTEAFAAFGIENTNVNVTGLIGGS